MRKLLKKAILVFILVIAAFVLMVCNEPQYRPNDGPNITELRARIDEAQKLHNTTKTATDSDTVTPIDFWADPDVKSDFQTEINKARTAMSTSTTQGQITDALNDLNAAITTFAGQRLKGTKSSGFIPEELDILITFADNARQDVVPSTNGEDVNPISFWVPFDINAALITAIDTAQNAEGNLDPIYNALFAALEDFEQNKKRGSQGSTKVTITGLTAHNEKWIEVGLFADNTSIDPDNILFGGNGPVSDNSITVNIYDYGLEQVDGQILWTASGSYFIGFMIFSSGNFETAYISKTAHDFTTLNPSITLTNFDEIDFFAEVTITEIPVVHNGKRAELFLLANNNMEQERQPVYGWSNNEIISGGTVTLMLFSTITDFPWAPSGSWYIGFRINESDNLVYISSNQINFNDNSTPTLEFGTFTRVDLGDDGPGHITYPLIENEWAEDYIDYLRFYSFPVTDGTTYRVWWNDRFSGDGKMSADIIVTGYYDNEDGSDIFTEIDSGWIVPQQFTATKNGTFILRVELLHPDLDGYSGIVYSTSNTRPGSTGGGELAPYSLTENEWVENSFSQYGQRYYSFPVIQGQTYYLWWNDSNQGDRTKTLDISVDAYYYDTVIVIFSGEDSAWEKPYKHIAERNGTIILRSYPGTILTPQGTYAIAYSTTDMRPGSFEATVIISGLSAHNQSEIGLYLLNEDRQQVARISGQITNGSVTASFMTSGSWYLAIAGSNFNYISNNKIDFDNNRNPTLTLSDFSIY